MSFKLSLKQALAKFENCCLSTGLRSMINFPMEYWTHMQTSRTVKYT